MSKSKEIYLNNKSRNFGLLLAIIFLFVAINCFFKKIILIGQLSLALFVIFFFVSVVMPKSLNGITKIWLHLGDTIGQFISPITLGLIFFVLITPFGIMTRLFGRDELLLKRGNKKSYWLLKNSNSDHSHSYERQF